MTSVKDRIRLFFSFILNHTHTHTHTHTHMHRELVFADARTLISKSSIDRELEQAVRFLHDNGTLLHYDDPLLSDFYFVHPQWLCDMLAHIVTVREINPLVKDGGCHLGIDAKS